ncbi:7-cyano-7-deazaguanine synthase QueC [Pseudidiomarina aestuarii]|uniref:7-cyano-7-deazaguanine synthase QueC n=1 Tax=Pseudidiomarina aestuarii TaxID=624146 RepID=UPI003A96C570
MAKVVVIYSGGMDSYTVLHRALRDGHDVYALSFHYGQRHAKELDYAARVCNKLAIPLKVVDIRAINQLLAGSSLTDNIDIPQGHYEEASMKSTVVPNRNMILLSLAIGYAVSIEAEAVYYGAHSGDHAIYPDCRPEFVRKMNDVSLIANYEPVRIEVPYLDVDKIAILADGLRMGLDYADTWTCYEGRELACGKCGACVERLEAFTKNQVADPIPYQS